MSIITLISDLGNKDYYLPSLKANILSQIDNINIVDISHEIDHFNILQGALVLKNCFRDFPRETVHIIAIDDELSIDNDHVAVYAHGHYFIGADNGFFSVLLDDFKPDKIVSLNINQKTDYLTFASRDVFVTAACHIKRGGTLELIGKEIDDFRVKKNLLNPVIESNIIKGVVTYIDNYGNVITNIDFNTFEKTEEVVIFQFYLEEKTKKLKKYLLNTKKLK